MEGPTLWELKWVLPSAVVLAAERISPGRVREGLERITRESKLHWARALARELLAVRRELERILGELRSGAATRESLVEQILGSLQGRARDGLVYELELVVRTDDGGLRRLLEMVLESSNIRLVMVRWRVRRE